MELDHRIVLKSTDLFLRFGIKSVSMDDIAKELGISKKTIYQYFSNKQDLLNTILQEQTTMEKSVVEDILRDSRDAIDEILKIARFVIEQLKEVSPHTIYDLQKYYNDSYRAWDNHHKKYIFTVIKNNILRGIEEGHYRNDIHADFLAKVYIEMINLVTDSEKFPLFERHFDQMYEQLINYHIRGLVSHEGYKKLEKYLNKV